MLVLSLLWVCTALAHRGSHVSSPCSTWGAGEVIGGCVHVTAFGGLPGVSALSYDSVPQFQFLLSDSLEQKKPSPPPTSVNFEIQLCCLCF
jgi:hypothetical protein